MKHRLYSSQQKTCAEKYLGHYVHLKENHVSGAALLVQYKTPSRGV